MGLSRRLAGEFLGTALLVATVVGSGIMADQLTGDDALALLANSLATAAILFVAISLFAPISGAHFNPAVTLVSALRGEISARDSSLYAASQIVGGISGTIAAHAMFALPLIQQGGTERAAMSLVFSEGVAAFGLVFLILAASAFRKNVAALVALYIGAAYWFTASTSFANPAVTIARSFTDTFSGIRPSDAPAFIAAQLTGAVLAFFFARWLLRHADKEGQVT